MKRFLKHLLSFALVAVIAFGSFSLVSAQKMQTENEPAVVAATDNANMLGDANLDGKVNIRDATDIQKFIAKIKQADEISELLADVNKDNNVNIKDATEIQKWLAKISTNDEIGMPFENNTDTSTATQPLSTSEALPTETTSSFDEPEETTSATEPATETDPAEDTKPEETTTAAATDNTEPATETDPAEDTKPEETTTAAATDNTEPEKTTPAATTENTEPTWSHYDPYQREIIEIFKEQGHNAYEEGMFYRVIYNYYKNATNDEATGDEASADEATADESTADEITPDYVLIWTSFGAIADEWFEVIIGDYALSCPGHCHPYLPGYYIYIPSTNTLMTIEEAYHSQLEGLETVFEEAPVFRPLEIDFKVIDEQRVSWYGSEETELFLLRHSLGEEQVIAKFEKGKAPSINIPHDEKGFYYDKIYVVSLNFLGGSNSTQTIDKITVIDGTLTVYRTVTKPEIQTPDMNYQYVLIELDSINDEIIHRLEDVTVIA